MRRGDGRILEANAAAESAYGYDRPEIRALTIFDLRAADTAPLTESQMAVADDRGLLFETVHRRKDGTTFPVEVSSRGATIDGGRMLISVVRDITGRKRAEEALRQNEERYHGFFDNLNEAVVVLEAVRDDRGTIIDWRCAASNDAHRGLFGASEADLAGTLMSHVMGRAALEQFHPRNCRVLADGRAYRGGNRCPRPPPRLDRLPHRRRHAGDHRTRRYRAQTGGGSPARK